MEFGNPTLGKTMHERPIDKKRDANNKLVERNCA